MERARQTSEEQREALNEFIGILVKKEVLAHKDKVLCAGSFMLNASGGTRPHMPECSADMLLS